MNLETSQDTGSHWVAIYKSCINNYYFDPYGILPTKEVYNYLDHFHYNKAQIQQELMECCGQLSLYVLYKLNTTNDSFDDIILNMKKEINSFLNHLSLNHLFH